MGKAKPNEIRLYPRIKNNYKKKSKILKTSILKNRNGPKEGVFKMEKSSRGLWRYAQLK